MDRYDDMVVFQLLARTGTISAAAAELNVAPSAVSRRLKALEDRLGVQLVQRTTRKMTLTPSGEAYLAGANSIVGQLDELEGNLQAGAGTLTGTIRMTAPLSFALMALPAVLDSFMRQHPGVVIDLHLSDSRVDLVAEGFDLALRIGELGNSTLKARRLCGIEFALCASPKFLEQHGDIQTPDDLQGLPACIYTGEVQGTIWRWRSPEGGEGQVQVQTIVKANNGDILRELAIHHHGLVCSPRFILRPGLEAGTLIEPFAQYSWGDTSLHAVYPPNDYMPARLRALLDHLADALKGGCSR
ncbi:LysR family transcriptional regulator [Parvularcula sp. LCG005]|uniref:LysR family transcriptional regulator n=1 Tax=Parvularcula sp. LCG005 TaxID=3078805 RepID=UPI002941C2B4|nr:LysR family transcriptional regulator [Parvularcula sp. LCG005]WOI53838.1 LysR family transcriptional regulator [Parvularcula sp. LCG005]